MTKLIIVNSLPTNRSFGLKLEIQWFIEKNYQIEFWDLTNIFFNSADIAKFFKNPDHSFKSKILKKFHNKKQLLENIHNYKNYNFLYLTKFFDYSVINDDWLFEEFKKNNINYFFQYFDPVKIIYPWYNLKKFINFVRLRYLTRKYNPKGIITSGNLGVRHSKFFYNKSKIINIPSIKIKWKNFNKYIQNSYSVFIDEAIIYSPDTEFLNINVCNDVNGYYDRLKKSLNKISQILDHKIIIAASDKYKYRENFFGNFDVLYDKTFDLIHYSNLVIGGGSLAMQQSIVSKKPVILVKDQSFLEDKNNDIKINEIIFEQKAIYLNKIDYKIVKKILKKDLKYYNKIEKMYFKNVSNNNSYPEILDKCLQN